MSKTSQRKISAYQSGLEDGLLGKPHKWIRHPQIKFYSEGYLVGKDARSIMPPPKMTFIQRLQFVVFGTAPNGDSYLQDREGLLPDYVVCYCGRRVDV